LFLSGEIIAQKSTFSGRILSSSDNHPVPYAHITLRNKAIGAISDEDGFFKLTVPVEELSNGQFIVSAIGFKSLLIDDMKPWNKELKLVPLLQELENVTVSASRMKLTAKDLVKAVIKKGTKLDKSVPLALDIEQITQHNGILTRHYFNTNVNLIRKESTQYNIPEIDINEVEYSYDAGALPTASRILSPQWILSTDFYTTPKLKKAKRKYSYEFTKILEIDSTEVFEVIVLQQKDTMSHSATWKIDYKFYFSTDNFDLIRFEKRELVLFKQGYYHMYMSETTTSNYRHIGQDDPFLDVSVENIQYVTRYNRGRNVIQVDRGSQLTTGKRTNLNSTKSTPKFKNEYQSVLDAISKNTNVEKLYLFIFWDESASVFFDNRLALFQLLEDYTFDELEIVCIGSPQKRSQWVMNAYSFPFYNHFYIDELSRITNKPTKQCQLYNGKKLLISSKAVSENIINAIKDLY